MKNSLLKLTLFVAALLAMPLLARAGFTLKEISPQTAACAARPRRRDAPGNSTIVSELASQPQFLGQRLPQHRSDEKPPVLVSVPEICE